MLLIDGHNLIGKLPDIALSDPDDEMKLVRVLENYHAMRPHEAILVVFDPGRDGRGGWTNMRSSSAGVAVRFAPHGTTADAVILKMLRDGPNARRSTVVSSDNAVRKSAQAHGAKVLSSEEFIVKLRAHANPRKRKPTVVSEAETREKPRDADVEYWSQFFKEPKHKPVPPKSVRSTAKPSNDIPLAQPQNSPVEKPREVEDIEYWLKVFGEPQVPATDADGKPTRKQRQSSTESDVDRWLKLFKQKKP